MEKIVNIDKDYYKIFVFSDVHGNYESLEALRKIYTNGEYDLVVFLGDAISMGPDGDKCFKTIKNDNIEYILGNHELYQTTGIVGYYKNVEQRNHLVWVNSFLSEDDINFMKNLPLKIVLNFKKKNIQFSHYLLDDDKMINMKDILKDGINEKVHKLNNYNYVFYGHDHKHSVHNFKNSVYIDVGSSGCVKGAYTYFTEITYNGGNIDYQRKKISFDREKFEERMKNISYPFHKHYAEKIFGINLQ